MAASAKIVDLRNLLAERFAPRAAAPSGQVITGIPVLDQATGGGLRPGSITEVISVQPSAGSALLIHSLLQLAQRKRFFMALIDGRDSFDPQTVDAATLRHLLWVRCEKAAEAIKAADFLLRDGNFSLVVLDLILNSAEELRCIPATSWYRLQRLVEPVPSAFMVMSRHNMVPSAHTKIMLENQWALTDLARDDALRQLQLRVRRAHPIVSVRA